MAYQLASQKAVLLLGCYAFAAVSLAEPSNAGAQEKLRFENPKWTAGFRNNVVKEWNWKPNQGVSLTTTEYAIDYVQRYAEEAEALTNELRGLVLFQTATHDIVVYQWTSEMFFFVAERSSGEIVANRAGHRYDEDLRFVDVDGSAPLELQRVTSGTSGTGLWNRWYRVFDLASGFDTMLEVEGFTDLHGCPEVQPRFESPDKNPGLATNDVSKKPKLRRFRMWAQLKWAGCGDMDAHPEFIRECEFVDKSRKFDCEDTFVSTATVSFEDMKEADSRTTANNIRWVLENADKLRAKGFRFSEGFLERLPRHLREGGQD